MRIRLTKVVLLSIALSLSGCLAGPHQLRRSVDDWENDMYIRSPWTCAAMWIVPVLPVCHVFAVAGDFLVTDPYAFWLDDAWDCKGTGFKHYVPESIDGRMDSFLIEDSKWLKVY